MGRRDDFIAMYADQLRDYFGVDPDVELLKAVTIGCGPCIYDDDGCLIAATQAHELKTVKDSFLKKKLGLPESPELMEAINEVLATYGKSNRHKFRAPVYYMLTVMFGKEDIYGMEAALEADLGKIKARF